MKLEQVLQEQGIGYEKHKHKLTYTAQRLAAEEHVSGWDVAKPVVVRSGNTFTMCVVPAPLRVDVARVAEVLKEPQVRLATEAEMGELCADCELGAEPPVGSLFGIKTIADERLREHAYLTVQAGTHTDALKLRREDWEKLAEPSFSRIALE
ncbi:MAG TPA: YbaK/EbsC family protein [Phycisphaerae bacterium]|nr:YbaK/EbsC family protein [Phycisphaerae bacterium]